MASDAPLIGLNVPLKIHCLDLSIFVLFHLRCDKKKCALQKSGLALRIMKAW